MPDGLSKVDAALLLDTLARRREQQEEGREELASEIRSAVRKCQHVMATAEIARHLGIDRSTLYRVYGPRRAT